MIKCSLESITDQTERCCVWELEHGMLWLLLLTLRTTCMGSCNGFSAALGL